VARNDQAKPYGIPQDEPAMATIVQALRDQQLELIGALFREYEDGLGVDLRFQSFEEELADLPGKYAPPRGRLLLALDDEAPAGCVALRPITDDVCEMKRLFVRQPYRGRGLGRALATRIINEARAIGYRRMCLDTLRPLRAAMRLYESLGFKKRQPYYQNPLPDTVYWELDLWENPEDHCPG
jgi:putative acetyltransferase